MFYCVNSMMCPHADGVKYADTVCMQHIMMADAHAVVSPAQAGWLEFRAVVGLAHQARKLNRRKEGISKAGKHGLMRRSLLTLCYTECLLRELKRTARGRTNNIYARNIWCGHGSKSSSTLPQVFQLPGEPSAASKSQESHHGCCGGQAQR